MNTPESSDFELSDFDMSNFERQLKSLAPRESTVHRDDLLFRAGYEAGIAAVSRGASKVDEASCLNSKQTSDAENFISVMPVKTRVEPWIQWVAVAMLFFVGAMCGMIGWQVGERRTVARYTAVKNSLKQLNPPGMISLPSISKSVVQREPPPPVYVSDDESRSSFASSNEPNYIELRDQVLRFGVDAMPESYSLAIPVKPFKERKALTPLSYGSVMELSTERY